jgi:hypothetical protein
MSCDRRQPLQQLIPQRLRNSYGKEPNTKMTSDAGGGFCAVLAIADVDRLPRDGATITLRLRHAQHCCRQRGQHGEAGGAIAQSLIDLC